MNILSTEKELRSALDTADGLIQDCVNGQLAFDTFLERYDSFYMRHALDGHESDDSERVLLEKFAERIRLHEAIWNEILVKVTTDEFSQRPDVRAAGFISKREGFVRLKSLVQENL